MPKVVGFALSEYKEANTLEEISFDNKIKLGRWLCWKFYRDPYELQHLGGVHEIFESCSRLDTAWAELLAGAYRFPQFQTTKRGGAASKWSRLGEVVWPGVKSIDGVGDVRAKEVLLYIKVAEGIEDLLRGPLD